jgi:hypothetical protein
MRELLLLLGALIAVFVVVLVLARLKGGSGGTAVADYSKKRTLFSPAERSFLGVLDQAVGDEYRVFGKIRVADVLEPRRGMSRSARQSALNRISAKHFDFVLCSRSDLSIACAVELDDASHNEAGRRDRDAFLAAACESAALPLLRVPAERTYAIEEVRSRLLAVIGAKADTTPQGPHSERSGASAGAPWNGHRIPASKTRST